MYAILSNINKNKKIIFIIKFPSFSFITFTFLSPTLILYLSSLLFLPSSKGFLTIYINLFLLLLIMLVFVSYLFSFVSLFISKVL